MKFRFLVLLCLSLLVSATQYAQVTITSKDSVNCANPCTTLYANVIGDRPTNAGVTSDDIYSPAIAIGFTFTYFGYNYTHCELGANGTIDFNSADAGGGDPWTISAALAGNTSKYNNICGPWCDIDIFYTGTPVGSETYSTDGVSPYRKFVVTWCGCSMYECPDQHTTSQIILYETTNLIEVHVAKKQICTTWNPSSPTGAGGRAIIGVEGPASLSGRAVVAPGRNWTPVWSALDEAWRFTPITGRTYTVTSIPYAPVPFASNPDSVYWYDATTGAYISTGDSINVCPATTTTYRAAKLGCADSSFGYYTISNSALVTPISSINPVRCGDATGSFTLSGLSPGSVDTIRYLHNGMADSAVVTVSGFGSVTVSGLPAGNYTNISVTQATCTTIPASVTLSNPPIAITSVTTDNPTTCYLLNGDIILYGLYPGTGFTVTYDKNGVPMLARVLFSSSTGSIVVGGLGQGTYSNITAAITTSIDSCISPPVGPYILALPSPPASFITATSHPSACGTSDGTITLRDFPPFSIDTISYTYNGTPGTSFVAATSADSAIFLTGLRGGVYGSFIITIGQCIYSVAGTALLDSPTISALFDTSIHLGCHGDTVFFSNHSSSFYHGIADPIGILYYSWNFGDGTSDTSSNLYHIYQQQGTYAVTLVADNHLCWDTLSIPVTFSHPLFDSFTASSYNVCQDTLVQFTNFSFGTPGTTVFYNWSFGDGATSVATDPAYKFPQSGTYNVMLVAHDFVPCYDTFTAVVQVDTLSKINVLATDTVICQGTYITFTGLYASLGNTGVRWHTGDGDSALNVNPLTYAYNTTGTFTVTTVALYRACKDDTATRLITVFAQPVISLGPDTSICAGSGAITLADNINGSNARASWLWSTGQTTPAIAVNTSGTYYATVNINNCYATDSVTVANDCYMDIPNAFTPNNDGVNDYFYPRKLLTRGLVTFKMDIYNRWGQLIFETTSTDGAGWDGKLNGVEQPSGVFVYIIDGTFKDGEKEHHQGNVTLLR